MSSGRAGNVVPIVAEIALRLCRGCRAGTGRGWLKGHGKMSKNKGSLGYLGGEASHIFDFHGEMIQFLYSIFLQIGLKPTPSSCGGYWFW